MATTQKPKNKTGNIAHGHHINGKYAPPVRLRRSCHARIDRNGTDSANAAKFPKEARPDQSPTTPCVTVSASTP